MTDPVRNWARPETELNPDLKKEVKFLRKGHDGRHFCILHPDMIETHNAGLFNHHQLEAFRQAVEDVRIELGMNAIYDTDTMKTPDGREILVIELVPHEQSDGSLPETLQ